MNTKMVGFSEADVDFFTRQVSERLDHTFALVEETGTIDPLFRLAVADGVKAFVVFAGAANTDKTGVGVSLFKDLSWMILDRLEKPEFRPKRRPTASRSVHITGFRTEAEVREVLEHAVAEVNQAQNLGKENLEVNVKLVWSTASVWMAVHAYLISCLDTAGQLLVLAYTKDLHQRVKEV